MSLADFVVERNTEAAMFLDVAPQTAEDRVNRSCRLVQLGAQEKVEYRYF